MFKLDSENALLATFRPKDRKLVELVAGAKFPMIVRGCHTWVHPAGGRVFLVFAVPGGAPTGIAFDLSGGGPAVPHMCDWCHCTGNGTQVGMLMTYVDSKRRVGVQVCVDLSCKQRLEEEADRTGRNATRPVSELIARMGRFASEALKIDLTGVQR